MLRILQPVAVIERYIIHLTIIIGQLPITREIHLPERARAEQLSQFILAASVTELWPKEARQFPWCAAVIEELAGTAADVVIESFRPGALARFGFDTESLRRRFPALKLARKPTLPPSDPHRRTAPQSPDSEKSFREVGQTFLSVSKLIGSLSQTGMSVPRSGSLLMGRKDFSESL